MNNNFDNHQFSGYIDNVDFIQYLLDYLKVLQEGRVKPNSNKESTTPIIHDSVDNLPDIRGVKNKLNDIFNIQVVPN